MRMRRAAAPSLPLAAASRRAQRAAALLLCVALMLPLSSCWSELELDKLAIVVGTGLDVGDGPDSIKLTAQVVKAAELGSGSAKGGGGSKEKAYVNISYTDKSVLAITRGLTHVQNRKLYFAHSNILIFSRDLAKLDMAEGMDAFVRDYESRLNVYLLIAKGSASEILEEEVDLEKTPAIHLFGLMENQDANSETVVATLRDYVIATLGVSSAPVAPMVELYEVDGKKHAKLDGTAIFKDGKMIGELDKTQTRGLLWVTGKVSSGAMPLETEWGQVTLQISRSSGSLKPVKAEDGTVRVRLKLQVDTFLENNETTQTMGDHDHVEMLKDKMKEAIRSEINGALATARALSADIFGFGNAIRRDYPKEWNKMKDNWDETFPKIELDIDLDIELRSTGGLTKPVVPGGAK